MKTLVIVLLSSLLVAGMVITPSQAGPLVLEELPFAKSTIGGMVESVDPASLTITIMTDLGKKESLLATKESVLEGLIKGDRVFCEMNEEGKIAKIFKATPIPNGSSAPEPKG